MYAADVSACELWELSFTSVVWDFKTFSGLNFPTLDKSEKEKSRPCPGPLLNFFERIFKKSSSTTFSCHCQLRFRWPHLTEWHRTCNRTIINKIVKFKAANKFMTESVYIVGYWKVTHCKKLLAFNSVAVNLKLFTSVKSFRVWNFMAELKRTTVFQSFQDFPIVDSWRARWNSTKLQGDVF